jgi:hypothetical protein
MAKMSNQRGEALTVILVVIPLLFGGVEHMRARHHKERAEQYKEQAKQLAIVADENKQSAERAVEAAENNAELAKTIGNDLEQCVATVEKYKVVESNYLATNESLADDLKTLESRIANTDLGSCVVPGWLVDEISGNSDGR